MQHNFTKMLINQCCNQAVYSKKIKVDQNAFSRLKAFCFILKNRLRIVNS